MSVEDGFDRWPTFALSPTEYERAVADLVKVAGHDVVDWQVEHLDPVEDMHGTYVIDVTVRFRLMGADFLIVFECKLLPRLLAGRNRGPLFLTDRTARARTPTLDRCPVTRKARLSYRRAAEVFEQATRPFADPVHRMRGFTLHQLRHSALSHETEDGTSTPMLLARSRHASVRSLERYTRPGVDAVAAHVARRDPAARRKTR